MKDPGALVRDRRLVPRAFDRAARRYDLLATLNPRYDAHLRVACELLAPTPDGLILDLCCGTGRSTAPLIEVYPDARIIGVDASTQMLRGARARLGARVPLVRADGAAPALRRESCDAALVAYGMRNMGDPDAFLRALYKLLRPGGRLALHEYALTDLRSRITWSVVARTVIIPTGWLFTRDASLYRYLHRSVIRFDRADEVVARLERNGFGEVERHDTTHWQRGIAHTFTATRP